MSSVVHVSAENFHLPRIGVGLGFRVRARARARAKVGARAMQTARQVHVDMQGARELLEVRVGVG